MVPGAASTPGTITAGRPILLNTHHEKIYYVKHGLALENKMSLKERLDSILVLDDPFEILFSQLGDAGLMLNKPQKEKIKKLIGESINEGIQRLNNKERSVLRHLLNRMEKHNINDEDSIKSLLVRLLPGIPTKKLDALTKEVLEIKYQYHDMFRNLPTTDKHDIELFNRLKNVKPLPKTPIVMRELPFIDDLA